MYVIEVSPRRTTGGDGVLACVGREPARMETGAWEPWRLYCLVDGSMEPFGRHESRRPVLSSYVTEYERGREQTFVCSLNRGR